MLRRSFTILLFITALLPGWNATDLKASLKSDIDSNQEVSISDLNTMAEQWLASYNPFIETGGLVVMEAEHYHENIQGTGDFESSKWFMQADGSATNGQIMTTPDFRLQINSDYSEISPRLSYQIDFNQTGTYFLWLKGRGVNPSGDSIHFGFDGQNISNEQGESISMDISDDYAWYSQRADSNRPTMEVTSTGIHTVDLWVREDGIKIDRLLITKSESYVPSTSNEPAESDGYVVMTADLDESGFVNQNDFLILASEWQKKAEPVEISEVMTDNDDFIPTVVDDVTVYPDWIEIHNKLSHASLNLTDWYLTDDDDDLTKWQFPEVVIEANGYLCVFASGRDDAEYPYMDMNGYFHTNFSLSKSGEYLALVNPEGDIVHEFSPGIPDLPESYTFGMVYGLERYFATATFEAENSDAFLGFVEDTNFSVNRGFYEEPFQLELASDTPDASIYYTVNGSMPSSNHGFIYDTNDDASWLPEEGIDGALQLNGEREHIEIVDYKGITGKASRTVSLWINTTTGETLDILSWGSRGSDGRWLLVVQNWTSPAGAIQLDVNGGYMIGSTNVCDGQWHHIAVTMNNDGNPILSEAKIYVDGAEETITQIIDASIDTASDANVKIGIIDDKGYRNFEGKVDDVRIYDRQLSGAEVSIIAGKVGNVTAGLVGQWELNETSGITAFDSTGNHDGIIRGNLYIDRSTVVRAVAYKAGHVATNIDTSTYLFLDEVIKQSPQGQQPGPGWPESGSYAGQVIDYGMDPDVVNDPAYTDQMIPAMKAIPTLSLVTPLDFMFNSSYGIYVNANQDGVEWERPASIELLNPDGSKGFQSECGLRIRGGFSRSGDNPKHAFRLLFKAQYGDSKLDFPIFEDEGADKFDNLDLRCSQNYSWSFQGDSRNTMLREVFSRDTQRDMGQPYTRSRYYHLYINGHYWGVYMTQERAESSFSETYLGGSDEDYDIIKVEAGPYSIYATDGNTAAWRRLWELVRYGVTDAIYNQSRGLNIDGSENPNYEKLVDPENLIDYMICTYYVGDFDGPISNFLGNDRPNNFYAVYNRTTPDGFKFMRHDGEHSMFSGWDRTGPWPAGSNFAYFNPQWLHQQLCGSENYRMLFADHVYRHFFNEGTLTPDNAQARLMERKDQIDLAIIAESARWGDSKRTYPFTRNNEWISEVNFLLYNYVYSRTDTVLNQFINQGWYPNIEPPSFSPNGGPVAQDYPLIMSNEGGSIYYTTDGVDPRLPGGGIYENAQILNSSGNSYTPLFFENAPKQVLIPSTSNGGNAMEMEPSQFTVVKINSNVPIASLTDAFTVLADSSKHDSVAYEMADVINYTDNGGAQHYDNDSPFPNATFNQDEDEFLVFATATIYIPDTGNWTFGVNSDDGFWLNVTNGVDDLTVSYPDPRGPADTMGTMDVSRAGLFTLTLLYYEHQGGAEVELFAGDGRYTSFRSYRFDLVGDTANGGLAVVNDWRSPQFDGSTWDSATYIAGRSGGVGYENSSGYQNRISYDVSDMFNTNGTCYIRIPFEIDDENLDEYESLTLNIMYDDAFVAYLNGYEVARGGSTPNPLTWNSTASNSRSGDAGGLEEFDISSSISLLKQGSNVLAIHGLNAPIDSSDFIISATLDVSSDGGVFSLPLSESTNLKTRSYYGGSWSALHEATFSVGPVAENLRITELMYHPEDEPLGDPCAEFIEFQNIGTQAINPALAHFSKGVDFTFPSITIEPGGIVIAVQDMDAFNSQYPDFTGVIAGVYEGKLDNNGERLTLVTATNNTILDFEYKDGWHPLTDGDGYSLTIVEPANEDLTSWEIENAWAASTDRLGSPGQVDQVIPDHVIVINEVLAHSHAELDDWIELYNTSDTLNINIGGWYLSDKGGTDAELKRYRIPENTWLDAGEYIVFYEDNSFGLPISDPCSVPFALSENGDEVYLTSARDGVLTGYRESVDFGASSTGVSFGRYTRSDGDNTFTMMASPSPNEGNGDPLVGPIVITEIMYNPLSGNQSEEYIELKNISTGAIPLFDIESSLPWQFTNGIDYSFPTDPALIIQPNGIVILASDPDTFAATYGPMPSGVIVLGPFDDGRLSNGGEKLELSMPGDIDEQNIRYYIRVDMIDYKDDPPWPDEADGDNGNGSSLTRIDPMSFGNDVGNWMAAMPSPGQ